MVMAYETIPVGEPNPSLSTKPAPSPFAENRLPILPSKTGVHFLNRSVYNEGPLARPTAEASLR